MKSCFAKATLATIFSQALLACGGSGQTVGGTVPAGNASFLAAVPASDGSATLVTLDQTGKSSSSGYTVSGWRGTFAISPDGRKVITDSMTDLFVSNLDGSERFMLHKPSSAVPSLTPTSAQFPSWGPDSNSILYAFKDTSVSPAIQQIRLASASSPETSSLVRDNASYPSFNLLGDRANFLDYAPGQPGIKSCRLDGQGEQDVYAPVGYVWIPAYRNDNLLGIISFETDNGCAFVKAGVLTFCETNEVSWSSKLGPISQDGRFMYVTSNRSGSSLNASLIRVDTSTGRLETLYVSPDCSFVGSPKLSTGADQLCLNYRKTINGQYQTGMLILDLNGAVKQDIPFSNAESLIVKFISR